MTARLLVAMIALLIVVGTNSPAEEPKAKSPTRLAHMVVLPDDIKWVDAPPGLPAGAKVAVLDGDPTKSGGTFVMRAKLPDGYTVPPHWHGVDEVVTVIEGSLGIGLGEKLDKSKVRYMPAGAFMKMNKEEKHFAIAKGE